MDFEDEDGLLAEITKWGLEELFTIFSQGGVTKELVWNFTVDELREMNVKPPQRKKYQLVIDKMKMEKKTKGE